MTQSEFVTKRVDGKIALITGLVVRCTWYICFHPSRHQSELDAGVKIRSVLTHLYTNVLSWSNAIVVGSTLPD